MASLNEVMSDAEDEIDLDLSGSVEFGDAPYGTYVAKLDRYELKDSKPNGQGEVTSMVVWFFQVASTIEVKQTDEETGELLPEASAGTFLPITRTMRSGGGAWRTRELYEALGGNMKSKDAKGHTKISPRSVVGNLVRCVKQPQENDPQYDELTGFEKASGKSALA